MRMCLIIVQFVNKDDIYLKICVNVFGHVSSRSALLKLPESTSHRPDLLELTAGSDISVVVTHEI